MVKEKSKKTLHVWQLWEECMCTHISTADRTNHHSPAMGGVHAHSHHRSRQDQLSQHSPVAGGVHAPSHHHDWQDEPTVASHGRSACALTSLQLAGTTKPTIASRGRSACALTSPRLTGQANNCQLREECMRTHITAAGRKSERLPAMRGVHAHSHHRCWQRKQT